MSEERTHPRCGDTDKMPLPETRRPRRAGCLFAVGNQGLQHPIALNEKNHSRLTKFLHSVSPLGGGPLGEDD
jgi:hypothetical protein